MRCTSGSSRVHPAAVQFVVFREEAVGQQEDVVAAVAQRRQVDRDDLEPVVEVVAEAAGLDLVEEDPVGGRDEPDVHRDRAYGADPPKAPAVEQRQDLGLHHRIQFADLVEEDRAAVGSLDQPFLADDRAGERASLVAEELGLEQLGRIAAQLMSMNSAAARDDCIWIIRASSPFPVPVSP